MAIAFRMRNETYHVFNGSVWKLYTNSDNKLCADQLAKREILALIRATQREQTRIILQGDD